MLKVLKVCDDVVCMKVCDGIIGNPKVSAFQKKIQYENQLNNKKVISKTITSPYSVFRFSFDTFDIHSITALTMYFELLSTPST